jgi:hypothetical protein
MAACPPDIESLYRKVALLELALHGLAERTETDDGYGPHAVDEVSAIHDAALEALGEARQLYTACRATGGV